MKSGIGSASGSAGRTESIRSKFVSCNTTFVAACLRTAGKVTEVEMSKQIPENADMRQLRTQAKELLQSIKSGRTTYEGIEADTAKLSDAQRIIAREYGFPSWPALVKEIELPKLLPKFGDLVYEAKIEELERLLRGSKLLQKHIDDPIFPFDTPALVRSANHPEALKLIPLLVKYGANPNTPSSWWAGGFSALSQATKPAAEMLVKLGARYDAYSAAKQGKVEILKQLLAADPESVNMAGGDGQRPLHVAESPEIVDILCDAGANVEQRDVDHESTPIQYQINNHAVVRALLKHGAEPDIFTAIAINDLDLLKEVLQKEPSARDSRIGAGPYKTVSNGDHIYTYLVGGGKGPVQFAAEQGATELLNELVEGAQDSERFSAAIWSGDEREALRLLADNPDLVAELNPSILVDAAEKGAVDAVKLLLRAGMDPTVTTPHAGTALHAACWRGQLKCVVVLAEVTPLEIVDSYFGATPLSWACHGSNWCRNPQGDYPAIVRHLLEVGARVDVPANKQGATMMDLAGNREDVKAILIEFGAAD